MTSQEPSDSYVPYLRRRNTPAQLSALQRLFETSPHPTRAQRQALANEIGMELKSVTNWFQNRRQTSRKKSISSNLNENNNKPTSTQSPSSPLHKRYRRSKTSFDRSEISLDRIATLSERPSLTLQLDSQRSALTPRKSNVRQKNPSSPSEIWTHMLSSPAAPPSAPDPEEVLLTALSPRAKILCPLEWACLKARQNRWNDEHPTLERCHGVEEGEAESKLIHLESATTLSRSSDASGQHRKNVLFSRPNMTPQFKDMEAAITLLGFKTRA